LLEATKVAGNTYWLNREKAAIAGSSKTAHLQPHIDE
jgi:hypothetical protein